jgi:predicted CXXCH cytochrome family protein
LRDGTPWCRAEIIDKIAGWCDTDLKSKKVKGDCDVKKKICVLLVGAMIVALSTMFSGAPVNAALTGTKHDFTAQTWSGGQICLPCHTPHNANTSVANAPLWNHTVSTSSYTLYTSTTFNGSATITQPAGYSKLCLSCHDGSVALDSFGGVTGTTFITGKGNLGTALTNDHPISFTYNAALATTDGSLKDPTTALSGLGGTVAANMLEGGTTMQCSSCHDVHNKYNVAKLLKKSNAGSALCQTCHSK